MTIIQSLLDNDLYQYTMANYAWTYRRDWEVTYKFRNRSFEVPLAECLDIYDLRSELNHLSRVRLSMEEIKYLRSLEILSPAYLDALAEWNPHDTPIHFDIDSDDGHLVLTYAGPWWQAVLYETPVLATVNEMYFKRFQASEAEGERRLAAKIKHLQGSDLRFMEFGTRRRYSRDWQLHVVHELARNCESMIGTSNVYLARAEQLAPMGTMAHQLFMVETARTVREYEEGMVELPLQEGEWRVLDQWMELYQRHPQLHILLPDTYSSAMFLQDLPWGQRPTGFRQDSGDPFKFGELVLRWCGRQGINGKEMSLLFSDSLDLRQMSLLYDTFGERARVGFGWGGGLTNDMGLEKIAIVIKPDSANGEPCVKLSDDIRKATGDPAAIEQYQGFLKDEGIS